MISTTRKKSKNIVSINNFPIEKYGITERKKTELDTLEIEVINAQHTVDQEMAIVTSLSAKSSKLDVFLAEAEANREQALSNRDLLDELVTNAYSLRANSAIAFEEMVDADARTKEVASDMRGLINKLIYSAEIINKLSNLVIRSKAKNPLISDELVTMVGTAGTDANNAVALTLVALKSAFASQASSIESEAATALQMTQSAESLFVMTGDDQIKLPPVDLDGKNLRDLLYAAYNNTKKKYITMHKACIDTTKQLNSAKSKLDIAQVKLTSLQSGLAAANAAALAS